MGVTSKKLKRKFMCKQRVDVVHMERKCDSLFLDSGAHALYTREVIAKHHANGYNWFKTKAFRKYVDAYAKLIKDNIDGIDYYANVDVIFEPDLSWKVLKYLENEHGLKPVPVIHYGTPLKWIDKHLEAGYEFLGIGGLGQEVSKHVYLQWADRVFDLLCSNPQRIPIARTHGFAMTAYSLMLRYPWWSVDSASWAKVAGFGGIYVPHYRNGKFDFAEEPYQIAMSHRSKMTKIKGKHYRTLSDKERKIVDRWLVEIDVPFGKIDDATHTPIEFGVSSQYNARAIACARFFQKLCQWLPAYPWPFHLRPKEGFVVLEGS